MHLIVISGAARPQARSNTAKIIEAFCRGVQSEGHTAEVYYLSDRAQWAPAREAFAENTDILFALPLYVESVSGTMLEFLESLPEKTQPGTRLSFLIQGGFPEASQSRCCESFLKTLPGKLGCEYGGSFIRGDMFGVRLLGEKLGEKMVRPFAEVGRYFARYGTFNEEIISRFGSPEFLPEKEIRQFERIGKYIQKWTVAWVSRRMGRTGKLDAKPYAAFVPGER